MFNTSAQVTTVMALVSLKGESHGTGFIGIVDHKSDKKKDKLATQPNMIMFTAVLAVGYIEGLHGSGVLVGYTDHYFGHIFTGCMVVGFVKATHKAQYRCTPVQDKHLDEKPRCLGIVSGHTVSTLLGVFTGVLIPYGDISAKETNVGAFGL